MKISLIYYIGITTFVLAALTVMGFYDVSFSLMFFTFFAGQILLLITVYKVLTDSYTTDKTFDDWYEDHPNDDK